jgi:hypothetical protein
MNPIAMGSKLSPDQKKVSWPGFEDFIRLLTNIVDHRQSQCKLDLDPRMD